MMYPLVRELAADGVPVTVTCRVLKIARQPYYRWLQAPATDAELEQAYRANALFDAHRDDPEFGYRFLLDEAREAGQAMAERTAWRICSSNGWWSAFGKPKRGKAGKPGPPVHDDLCAVVDDKGRVRHDGGVVEAPGLYLMGQQFLRRRKSSLIDGAGDDARALSGHLAAYLKGEVARGLIPAIL